MTQIVYARGIDNCLPAKAGTSGDIFDHGHLGGCRNGSKALAEAFLIAAFSFPVAIMSLIARGDRVAVYPTGFSRSYDALALRAEVKFIARKDA